MAEAFSSEIVSILMDGGYLMIPLVFIALFIYGTAFKNYYYFSKHSFYKTNRADWENWRKNPESLTGEAAVIVKYIMDGPLVVESLRGRFDEVRSTYLTEPVSGHRFLMILINTAPLMGLLGTVTGMLTTFSGLAVSRSGSTVDQIAGGISEALITTQTGLMIAIPAYVLAYLISKRRNEMENALTGIESVFIQHYNKNER